ncbi:MAG: hypothetical protein ACK52I_13670 [Pseudomonadota bacterium]
MQNAPGSDKACRRRPRVLVRATRPGERMQACRAQRIAPRAYSAYNLDAAATPGPAA